MKKGIIKYSHLNFKEGRKYEFRIFPDYYNVAIKCCVEIEKTELILTFIELNHLLPFVKSDKFEQLKLARSVEKFVINLFRYGDGRLLFLPKYAPLTIWELIKQSKRKPGPIIAKFIESKSYCVSCDADGHSLYGAAMFYRWKNYLIAIYDPRNAEKYIYESNDRAIEPLHVELKKLISGICNNGIMFELSKDFRTY